MPKTGTSYLQKHVFPKLSKTHYIEWGTIFFAHYFQKIKYLNPSFYFNEIKQKFNEYLYLFDEYNLVISDESLTVPFNSGKTIEQNAIFLKKIFNDAKIIITIREQVSMLESLYLQTFRKGFWISPEKFTFFDKNNKSFIEFGSENFPYEDWFPYIDLKYFEYYQILEVYSNYFGKESVYISLYEELKQDSELYVANLCGFIGVDFNFEIPKIYVNKTMGKFGYYITKLLNIIAYRPGTKIGIFIEKPFRIKLIAQIDKFDSIYPVEKKYGFIKSKNILIRNFIIKATYFVSKINSVYIGSLFDKLFYKKYYPFNIIMKEKLKERFDESNKVTALKYCPQINSFWK